MPNFFMSLSSFDHQCQRRMRIRILKIVKPSPDGSKKGHRIEVDSIFHERLRIQ